MLGIAAKEQNEEQRMKRIENNLRDHWDNSKKKQNSKKKKGCDTYIQRNITQP